jgi:hypothetical protein
MTRPGLVDEEAPVVEGAVTLPAAFRGLPPCVLAPLS